MLTLALQQVHEHEALHKAAAWFFGAGGLLMSLAVSVAVLLGLFMLTLVVAPGVTQRCTAALRERNFLSLGAGVVLFVLFLLLAKIGEKAPVVGLAAAGGFAVALVVGLASAAEDIGRRLAWLCGKDSSRAAHLATGWLVFATAACVPFVGWFLVLPYVALSGVGSLIVAAFTRAGAVPSSRGGVDLDIR